MKNLEVLKCVAIFLVSLGVMSNIAWARDAPGWSEPIRVI